MVLDTGGSDAIGLGSTDGRIETKCKETDKPTEENDDENKRDFFTPCLLY
jgi:hypothetical protein